MNEIQVLVDSLAERPQRPVGLDDRRFRAIAYSSHTLNPLGWDHRAMDGIYAAQFLTALRRRLESPA